LIDLRGEVQDVLERRDWAVMKPEITGDNDRILRRYRRLHQYTGEVLFFLTADGGIKECNERVDAYFSRSLVGKKITDVFEGIDFSVSSLFQAEIVHTVLARTTGFSSRRYSFLLSFIPIVEGNDEHEVMVIGKDLSKIESYREENQAMQGRIEELEHEQKISGIGNKGDGKTIALANALRKLERTKGELEKTNQTLIKELELAAILQKSLIPQNIPEDSHLRFAFHYEPMQFVGGDYYDVLDLGDGKKGIIIADVSGHGVSSAFIAAMLKISFTSYAPRYHSPAEVLSKLNAQYCEVIQTGEYVTIFYGIVDPQKSRMIYCGAGHPRPLFLTRRRRSVELLSSEGFFIGMFDQAEYTDREVQLREGDRFMIFTDGVTEAYSDEKGEQFGEKRLRLCFEECREEPLERMIETLIGRVKDFMKKSIFYDDLAIVAVEYKKG
jgi:serine phosphatase RsbU (regulator of sigma subunit)